MKDIAEIEKAQQQKEQPLRKEKNEIKNCA
jgi:hypothetical protein